MAIGFQITWRFTINTEKQTIFRIIAKDDYLSDDIATVKIPEAQATGRISHLKFRKEFDKIKMGFNFTFSIPPYQETDINYQDLLNLLR